MADDYGEPDEVKLDYGQQIIQALEDKRAEGLKQKASHSKDQETLGLGKAMREGGKKGLYTPEDVIGNAANTIFQYRKFAKMKGEEITDEEARGYMNSAVEIIRDVFSDLDKEEVISDTEEVWRSTALAKSIGEDLPVREIIEGK